jgi:hypothetical protein
MVFNTVGQVILLAGKSGGKPASLFSALQQVRGKIRPLPGLHSL